MHVLVLTTPSTKQDVDPLYYFDRDIGLLFGRLLVLTGYGYPWTAVGSSLQTISLDELHLNYLDDIKPDDATKTYEATMIFEIDNDNRNSTVTYELRTDPLSSNRLVASMGRIKAILDNCPYLARCTV
ncbi:hypothetical protein AJ80_06876 [Polytolypa hystricis UAMH7299]|uniref:Uncharacterized protein n=1 Tax=Polytolypa hystricis (strain UAMH7299) TaxID=1447883 RepID=A0A2B7XU94_POLH7|nr:hypothetical protein AJ80_06876 [Polytolypa hystricis UAMH7299]